MSHCDLLADLKQQTLKLQICSIAVMVSRLYILSCIYNYLV